MSPFCPCSLRQRTSARRGVAAYAQRAGMSVEAFLDQLGPVLTTEHLAKAIGDVVTGDNYSAPPTS